MWLRILGISVVVGCTTIAHNMGFIQPGGGVTTAHVQRYCESREQWEELLAKAKVSAPQELRPQVGWSACRVLAALGRPMRTAGTETATSKLVDWYYRDFVGSVVLVQLDGGDQVTAVSAVLR